MSKDHEVNIQRAYYADTAHKYDDMHVAENDEHAFALSIMIGMVQHFDVRSILDIGSGTGRALIAIKKKTPNVEVVGIEPSQDLRNVGYSKGLSQAELIDGDAMAPRFSDRSFDLVCEFGALHHIPKPSRAVSEMLRVSRKAIFISDSNNFGQGSNLARFLKQAINCVGLWPLADFIKTKGKGYTISEGDGVSYSYSVFNDYRQISEKCQSVHVMNTTKAECNPYRSAPHLALLGIKSTKL